MKKAENPAVRRQQARQRRNAEFVRGLLRRRPEMDLGKLKAEARADLVTKTVTAEAAARVLVSPPSGLILETIVDKERPVLFVENDWINQDDVWAPGDEAKDLIAATVAQKARLQPLMPLIGRIDATHFPNMEFVGSGWLIAPDVVVTNRHVASLIARWDGRKFTFRRGVGGNTMTSTFDTLREFDDLDLDDSRRFAVTEVLYIEPESAPCDIAFLKVARRTDGTEPTHIRVAPADLGDDERVLVVGYPARATRKVIPDQDLMEKLYRNRFDVKRAAPGFTMSNQQGSARHDCTTLGGNSGSVVLDLRTGEAVGLHFAGLYEEANYAVPASALNDYVRQRRWTRPPTVETTPAATAAAAAAVTTPLSAGSSVTVPLTITLGLGGPSLSFGGAGTADAAPASRKITEADAEAAVKAFWGQRPEGVVGARVGYDVEGDRFSDEAVIAASVPADQLAAVAAAGPKAFQGVPVRYYPASPQELVESLGVLESSSTIAYDDNLRTGSGFSFALVDEEMDITAHVGPEYSWDVLKDFLHDADGELVSGIYEFHAPHIFDEIESRLAAGASLRLVMDNKTFHGGGEDAREARFEDWAHRFTFERVVAPEGGAGLISDAYHIKVTVRDDGVFWLSSGNWKDGTSQPVITQAQRDHADIQDLPGNREWHVVIKNAELSKRFRNHLNQDFTRSRELGAGPVPEAPELLGVEVALPLLEGIELERPAPGRVLEPKRFAGRRRVTPLLTPDRRGAVYSETVLELIRSAQSSLLFQIPYISMPSNPTAHRGFIDVLIAALTQKLKTLDDARLLLSSGSKVSAPAHVAWFFKSKGVDVANRLKVIDRHHTKGMIVDDARCLVGSHNWSKPGVSLNRDASLLFEDAEVSAYYKEAFDIDWARARRINPRRFVKPAQEAVGDAAAEAPSFRRVPLADLLAEMGD